MCNQGDLFLDEWDTDSGYNQLSSSFSRLTVQDGCRDHSHFQERIQNVESPGLVSKLIAVLIDMSGECSYRYSWSSCNVSYIGPLGIGLPHALKPF